MARLNKKVPRRARDRQAEAAAREERARTQYLARNPCFQCDLDIPHVCFHGMQNVKWG